MFLLSGLDVGRLAGAISGRLAQLVLTNVT